MFNPICYNNYTHMPKAVSVSSSNIHMPLVITKLDMNQMGIH